MKKTLSLPSMIAFCEQCDRNTPTKILFMRAGYGNACAACGRLRRGKPYLSKAEFQTLKPDAAKGGTNEAEAV
jgi:hypothetical protein